MFTKLYATLAGKPPRVAKRIISAFAVLALLFGGAAIAAPAARADFMWGCWYNDQAGYGTPDCEPQMFYTGNSTTYLHLGNASASATYYMDAQFPYGGVARTIPDLGMCPKGCFNTGTIYHERIDSHTINLWGEWYNPYVTIPGDKRACMWWVQMSGTDGNNMPADGPKSMYCYRY